MGLDLFLEHYFFKLNIFFLRVNIVDSASFYIVEFFVKTAGLYCAERMFPLLGSLLKWVEVFFFFFFVCPCVSADSMFPKSSAVLHNGKPNILSRGILDFILLMCIFFTVKPRSQQIFHLDQDSLKPQPQQISHPTFISLGRFYWQRQ